MEVLSPRVRAVMVCFEVAKRASVMYLPQLPPACAEVSGCSVQSRPEIKHEQTYAYDRHAGDVVCVRGHDFLLRLAELLLDWGIV